MEMMLERLATEEYVETVVVALEDWETIFFTRFVVWTARQVPRVTQKWHFVVCVEGTLNSPLVFVTYHYL